MPTRMGEWASYAERERHFSCEGITQQPGPFYNGNFSSSIWGNLSTPPIWRDMPPSSHGSCSDAYGHTSGLSSFDRFKLEPVTSCKSQPLREQSEGVSKWPGFFSSGSHTGKHDAAGSPFTFGFPPPPSAPSFSCGLKNESMQSGPNFSQSNLTAKNADVSEQRRTISGGLRFSEKKNNECFSKERALSMEELSKSWAAMLQAQAELFGSLDGSFTHSLAGDQALASDGQQPLQHGQDNSLADAEMQSSHKSGAGPDLAQSETARSISDKKENLNTFVYSPSSASLGMNFNVGFSQKRGLNSPVSRSRPSLSSAKGRRPNIVIKRRSSAAPTSRASQPGSPKRSMDNSHSNDSFLKFTMNVSDANCSQGPEPHYKDRSNSCGDRHPQTPSSLPAAAGFTSQDKSSISAFNAKNNHNSESQHAQAFDNLFSAWHPFPSSEEDLLKDCIFAGAASSKGVPSLNNFDRNSGRTETIAKAALWEDLSKTSIETNRTFEEPKLTEFDLNSPDKLSAEDFRERAAKGVKFGEEVKRQKENQEPNFSFGNQKGSKPFVFGSSRATCNTKHSDDITKNACSFNRTKDSKILEHLVAKLGERMANLGKSHDNLGDHEIVFEGSKNCNAFDNSPNRFGKDQKEKGKETCRSKDPAHVFEKNDTIDIDHSVDEIREQLTKLGKFDAEVKVLRDKTDAVGCFFSGTMDGIGLEHAVRELRERISKVGHFEDRRQEETVKLFASEAHYMDSKDSSSIMRAVEELTKQIAKLNKAVRDRNENGFSSSKLQQCDAFTVSVEEICERIKTCGKVDEKGSNHDTESKVKNDKKVGQEPFVFTACRTTAQKDNDISHFHRSKTFVNNNQNGKVQFNPFASASSTVMFSSNQAQPSSSCHMANPSTAGQPSLGNPFAERKPSMANPFTAGQPSVANPFTAGQPSTIPEVYSGTKVFSFERPSAGSNINAGSYVGGFEFQGSKGPLKGTTMQRKSDRAGPNLRTGTKANLAKSRRKAHFTSSHSPGSPMDFSPSADNKVAPSSPLAPSGKAEQESGPMSHVPKSEEVESINVEEIRIATSNLTFGIDGGSCKGCQKGSGLSEGGSDGTHPFVLGEKKGTWKRAPRKGTAVFTSTKNLSSKLQNTSGPKMACGGSRGIDRGTANSSSPLVDSKGVSPRVVPQKHTTWDSSSGYLFNEKVETCSEKDVTGKISFALKFGEMDIGRKATITGERPASSLATKSAAAEQMCENWRLRGNQAYSRGDYKTAEDCYTQGASSILPWDTSESCIRASMLCYSNRAATRMAVGRMREALADCKQAIMLDSSFLRVRIRAASCHLALGESMASANLFTDCWRLANEKDTYDSKVLEEAMDGVRKSQNFDDLLEKASKLLQKQTSTDASAALQLLNEALTISPLSEATQDLKAQALFSLRRFEDVVQLCQKTLPAAEENHGDHHHNESLQNNCVFLNLWRWHMCGKALFQLGRLDESLSLLTKYDEATCGLPSDKAADIESCSTTLSLIRDLLRHKAAGNEAFQAGRHAEAVEHYTAALLCNSDSRPYNAVCFCNRAAASQALGLMTDAIADCSRAIVLDSSYAKAISRRATLYETIRDFGQTCNDLQRLITLLERQEGPSKSSKMTKTASKSVLELRQARARLSNATKEVKKDYVVDHYLILGLDVSCSETDIKKAYRRAALKHHPDKAGQFLVRGENGDDGNLWKEVGDEFRRDAERLFKIIGESYAILSDKEMRAQYNLEHQMFRVRNSTYPGHYDTEDDASPYEKTSPWRREHKDDWSGRSPGYQRWQNRPDAAQPDTYSGRSTRDSSKPRERRHRGRRSDYFYWEAF